MEIYKEKVDIVSFWTIGAALIFSSITAPEAAFAQAPPGTTVYPSCDPGAAPLNSAIRADWQAFCAKQQAAPPAAAAAPEAPTAFPYCNPEAAPPDPGVRFRWEAYCAAAQQPADPAQPAPQGGGG